jgi:hypothetical protein
MVTIIGGAILRMRIDETSANTITIDGVHLMA